MAKAKSALRRAAALLAALCLAASMTLPVYAESAEAADTPAIAEQADTIETPAPEGNTTEPQDAEATPTPEPTAEPTAEPIIPPEPAAEPTTEPIITPEPTAEPTTEPTITPEITAKPTSTPKPTHTPEPTVTPAPDEDAADDADEVETAFAKQIKQISQINDYSAMYSAEESIPDSCTLYLAVNTTNYNAWKDKSGFNMKVCIQKAVSGETQSILPMQDINRTTLDGRKIYSVTLAKGTAYNADGKVYRILFQYFEGNNWGAQDLGLGGKDPTQNASDYQSITKYADQLFDGNTSEWQSFSLATLYAGQEMQFQNKTDTELQNVTACFYKVENGEYQPVGEVQNIGNVAANTTVRGEITIPESDCAYVQFKAGNEVLGKTYYNFYNEGEEDATVGKFAYKPGETSCFIYNGAGEAPTWGVPGTLPGYARIYFDATFSYMSYENMGEDATYGMPDNSGSLYCTLSGGSSATTTLKMSRLNDKERIWYVDIPSGYTTCQFSTSNTPGNCHNGTATAQWKIEDVEKYTEPCFYADSSDDVIAKYDGQRGGYWDEKSAIRDVEKGKTKQIVTLDNTNTFTAQKNTKYISTTLYDYYTDYELNGNNRNTYSFNDVNTQRGYVTFEQFDRALSNYYKQYADKNKKTINYPLYTGHFQPNNWGSAFSGIAPNLNLYGWSSTENDTYWRFIAVNNSAFALDNNHNAGHSNDTFQGLVGNQMANGMPVMAGTTDLAEPHFNEAFLTGTNAEKAVLGKVYKDVSFPFTQDAVFAKDKNNPADKEAAAKYWYFDSNERSLYLKQDTANRKYYLEAMQTGIDSNGKPIYTDKSSKNVDSNSTEQGTYGFFPFNQNTTPATASKYNYGFGAKLQFDFTLTNDGKVVVGTDEKGEDIKVPIKFFFSGDDDVWVYIDGQLVLDVGGAHGKASGLLEFGDNGTANTVTPYVSSNKAGGVTYTTTVDKSVYFNGKEVKFTKQGKILVEDDKVEGGKKEFTLTKGTTHTLTMFYMERGMWESNMAVAYNFPDHNELQVEKQVDVSNVDSEFQHFFTDDTLRRFTVDISNQATHYGTYTADATYKDPVVATNFNAYRLKDRQNVMGYNILTLEDEKGNPTDSKTNTTVHWYAYADDHKGSSAKTTDKQCSQYRYARYGQIELNNALNVGGMDYLTFQLWPKNEQAANQNNQAELVSNSKLYLQLEDSAGNIAGCGTQRITTTPQSEDTYLSDLMGGEVKTYPNATWSTVKIDLTKMQGYETLQDVRYIRIGYDYQRNIFFRNFTFGQTVTVSTKTGFTTKQWQIPDYKSATSGRLETPVGAQYTYKGDTKDYAIDSSGEFGLANGDVVTFRDQFRRGSYISLNEEVNDNLFSTRWEIYENDWLVTDIDSTDKATVTYNGDMPNPLQGVGTAPDDNRIEAVINQPNEGQQTQNTGYTTAQKPADAKTIVFRSYSDPDGFDQFTKLRVKFINTVRVGDLQIIKQVPDDEYAALKDTEFTFDVTFTNIGGLGLEGTSNGVTKTITLKPRDKDGVTLTNIPAGTEFTITERDSKDFSLKDVTVMPNGTVSGNTVHGMIVEKTMDDSGGKTYNKVTFTNTARKLIDLTVKKQWQDTEGNELKDLPESIWVKLQRRYKGDTSADNVWKDIDDCPAVELKKEAYTGEWKYIFTGLDQYELGESGVNDKRYYEYRVVESADRTKFVETGGTIVLTTPGTGENGTDYKYTVGGDSLKIDENTGDAETIIITNQRQKPKYQLEITKQGIDGENEPVLLKGVQFTLEVKETDGSYTAVTGSLQTTDGDGKCSFTGLEPGSYRLTEVKTAEEYNLLAEPIEFALTEKGDCTLVGGTPLGKVTGGAAKGYTIALTINNRKGLTLPHTGADAPSLWVLIGLPLLVAGLLVLVFRYNRKGGKRS